jgi:formate dehydrogenase maturation protein FdhE
MSGDIDNKILDRLDAWEKDSLPGPIEVYIRLMRIQTEAKQHIKIQKNRPSTEVIAERLSSYTPLLTFDDMELDWSMIKKLFGEALSVISEYTNSVDPLRDIPLNLKEISRVWYEGKHLPKLGLDEDTLRVTIHTALKPFLAAYADAFLPQVQQKRWRRGYCPICGGRPNFAFLSKEEEGARWLLCARCDAEWLFQRLKCPFCGIEEQKSLAYFADEKGAYRVYVCERCKGYIKAIDLRQVEAEVLLPLEWIATLDLDRQACELGYSAENSNPA